jgi:hypothetical protein
LLDVAQAAGRGHPTGRQAVPEGACVSVAADA